MESKKQPKKRAEKYEEKVSFNGTFTELLNIAIGDNSIKDKSKLKTSKK